MPAMPNHDEYSALMRLVAGELDAEQTRGLKRRLGEDPEFRRLYERLRTSWDGLELVPPAPVPATFHDAVMTVVRRLEASEVSWAGAPVWVRSAAAAALVVGWVAGLGAGSLSLPPTEPSQEIVELDEIFAQGLESASMSLAEAYWQELEQGGETLLGETLLGEPGTEDTDSEPSAEGEVL